MKFTLMSRKLLSQFFLALLAILFWFVPSANGQDTTGANKDLEEMDIKFCFDLAELHKPIQALRDQYLEQLKSEKAQLQQAGNLNAVLAYNKEVEILTKSEDGEPFDDAPDDPLAPFPGRSCIPQSQTSQFGTSATCAMC